MRYAINVPCFSPFDDLPRLAEHARRAEENGWHGFFVWDHVQPGVGGEPEVFDPWIALALIADRTDSVRLGPLVTPLPRRRPWVVARQAATIDHLSGGRLTLGVGLGYPAQEEFTRFGEDPDLKQRAAKLDEGLAILRGLWSGEPFSFQGEHYQIDQAHFLPRPVQDEVPIWVAGMWPNHAPMRRAARFQGAVPLDADARPLSPNALREIGAYLNGQRAAQHTSDAPFDLVVAGNTVGQDLAAAAETIAPYAAVGLDWWVETAFDFKTLDQLVQRGPPAHSGYHVPATSRSGSIRRPAKPLIDKGTTE